MTILHYLFRAIIGAAVIAVVALLLFKQCGDEDNSIRMQLKELEQRHKADSIAYAMESTRLQDSIDRAAEERQLQVAALKEQDKKLAQSETTINRLIAIIRNAPTNPDSSFALVSKDYKEACDSLPGEIDKAKLIIAEKDTAINGVISLMDYEIRLRDSVIEKDKQYIGRLNNTIISQRMLINEALRSGKARGKLLGGVGNLFLPDDPFNPHIAIAYQTKGGKQYQAKAGIINGLQYYEMTVLTTLFK